MVIEYVIFIGLILISVILTWVHKSQADPTQDPHVIERLKTESPIERRLYNALVFNGYNPKTQVRCGKYRIDIALLSYRLALECDGKAYHSSLAQKARDRRRDAYLRKQGWTVLRFSGSIINGNMPAVLKRIKNECDKLQSS